MARLAVIAAGATILAAACGGGAASDATPTDGVQACGTEPLPPCPPFGQPVSLEIETGLLPDFPPLPEARAAALPGETVNATLEGFRPGEEARVFSTDNANDGRRATADSDGNVEISVPIGSSAAPGQDYFVVVQPPSEEGDEPIIGSFAIVTLDREEARSSQGDVLWDALDSIGWGGGR